MDISLTKITHGFSAFLARFHAMIFVVFILGGLVVAVFMLNLVLVRSLDTTQDQPTPLSSTFDQSTIDRIDELKTADDTTQLQLPAGRINPFVE